MDAKPLSPALCFDTRPRKTRRDSKRSNVEITFAVVLKNGLNRLHNLLDAAMGDDHATSGREQNILFGMLRSSGYLHDGVKGPRHLGK